MTPEPPSSASPSLATSADGPASTSPGRSDRPPDGLLGKLRGDQSYDERRWHLGDLVSLRPRRLDAVPRVQLTENPPSQEPHGEISVGLARILVTWGSARWETVR